MARHHLKLLHRAAVRPPAAALLRKLLLLSPYWHWLRQHVWEPHMLCLLQQEVELLLLLLVVPLRQHLQLQEEVLGAAYL
jgi:hypothetical protein